MARVEDPLTHFLAAGRSDLRRIASRTCGEHSIEDVCGEAWLVTRRARYAQVAESGQNQLEWSFPAPAKLSHRGSPHD